MGNKKNTASPERGRSRYLILLFCAVIAGCVSYVLLEFYRPNQNAFGALATVSMDVICLLVLMILVLSITLEKERINRTTKLFVGLMLAAIWALFWDFMTWSFDGSLTFAGWTYVFTVASLCMGSVLATFFSYYLCSYMDDMYGMKNAFVRAKICLVLNVIAFILTFSLAITKQAFVFNNGHYETGALYDYVTVIPILTVLYMTIFTIVHIRTIGIHDVIGVVGYNAIMIGGALIESSYRIGTTYVGITVANVFIFIMLQNKLIGRVKQQKKMLDEKITSQYAILESMAGIYSYVNYIDLEEMTAKRFDFADSVKEPLDLSEDSHSFLNQKLCAGIEDELKEKFWAFTNLSTLASRMAGEKIITAEFCHKEEGWFRAQYIRIGESTNTPVKQVIYAIRNIDEEKRNVEKWIRRSNTDEMTGFFNRYAYEKDISNLEKQEISENLVYVSIDVNSLKVANDTLGHDAGDELIIGACNCISQCFGRYGKVYRIGGDEFVAIIYADEIQLEKIKADVEERTENWHGRRIEELALACGFVTGKEAANMSLHQMAVLADKRMYEEKTKYYQKKGIDRRGQRDAHVALCELYTKILKVNITDDTYQIVNMTEEEQTEEKGFADSISKWLHDFGVSGQVHPDDLEGYLEKTNPEYLSNCFKAGNSSLLILYRRKYNDEYKKTVMEIIPANDYTDESQNLFLYVKNIEQ